MFYIVLHNILHKIKFFNGLVKLNCFTNDFPGGITNSVILQLLAVVKFAIIYQTQNILEFRLKKKKYCI